MARRRGKNSSKQDDSWLPLEPPAGQSSRGFNEYVIPGVLLLIVVVGGSGLGWVCSEHQHTIESLSETLASMQARITKLQQQLGTDNAQFASVGGFEKRLVALEDASAKAQRQAELALAASEQIKFQDLQSKVWNLQTEMNDKLAEIQQNTISIAALNAIIKNKSIEFEVMKQSVNTMLSANTELAIQISGFSSMFSVTKLRLDEQISVVDDLMFQLEGQKREINEIKELFTSNQESLAINTQELMDIKELLESEQIKRTQTLEKRLRSLYKRLEDHQMKMENLHFHLAAQLEALQIQFLPGVQQEGLQVEEQITTSNNRERKKPDKELENTEEDEFTEEKKIREEDGAKQDDEFNREQAAVKVEASEWPVEEPRKEIHISSEEPVIDTEENVAEEQNEVGITEELETLQEAHMATNEIEESVVDELQIALEDSDCVTGQTGDIMDEEVEVNVGGEIKIHSEKANIVTSKTKKQKKVPDVEEIQTPLEDSSTVTTKTEEAAMEKQVELTPAQEMEKGSEETDTLLNIIDEVFNEEHAEHAPDEIHNVSNEVSNAEIKSQEDGNAEQESETAVEKIQIPSDERDTATNGNVNNQMRDVIPTETEQEAVEELTAASAKESVVSEKSVEEV
ncbi:kinesin-like protein KIF15 [Neoarius graeffei]|uniref:kinesin-like protein KIF15 n=1 Tax=Neoarius graeffei TaxID=443677 RepID=UPI00298C681E|nr:kinesin-like protein KIF15 [Neoarius graeffei]